MEEVYRTDMKEALFYEKKDDKCICYLCPHNCVISLDKIGRCRTRKNVNGKLYSLIYGKATSVNLDPIEKKPLYHFYPGSYILSLGTYGCNFKCPFCQNWRISQRETDTEDISPDDILELCKSSKGNIGVSYTYNEPFIWYEFVYDCSKIIKKAGFKNVLVTNGFIQEKPLLEILQCIDALNIDIKSYSPEFYKKICSGKLENVLNTAKIAKGYSLVEITNLIIPTLNDKEEDIEKLCRWTFENLGENTPVHFSRYFPNYEYTIHQTPISTLQKAREIAIRCGLKYVYIGNVWEQEYNQTYCPKCKCIVVKRNGYNVSEINIKEGKCKKCLGDVHLIM